MCNLETSRMWRPWLAIGCSATGESVLCTVQSRQICVPMSSFHPPVTSLWLSLRNRLVGSENQNGTVMKKYYCPYAGSKSESLITHLVGKCKAIQVKVGQALEVPERWSSQISRQSVYIDAKLVSPTHRPPLPSRKYFWYLFL